MGSRNQRWLYASSVLLVMQHCQAESSPKAALPALGQIMVLSHSKMRGGMSCCMNCYHLSPSSSCQSPLSASSTGQPLNTGRAAYKLAISKPLVNKSRTPMSPCKLTPSSTDASGPSLPNCTSPHICLPFSTKFPPCFSLMPHLRANGV